MRTFHHAALASTGVYVPEIERSNDALIAQLGDAHRETIEKLEHGSGITRRFVAPDDWATSDLAVAAGRDALERAGLAPSDLDLILVGTDSPDYVTPATSVIVQHKLGAHRAGTFDVGCACASFPTAIAAAAGMIASSPGIERVLVIGAYLMRRLADPRDPISFFYGDGAGAAVLVRSDEPGFLASAFRADGRYARSWMIASGGTAEPASEQSVREGRTQVRLHEPYPRAVNDEGWPAIVRDVTARASLAIADVDCFVFTQVRRGTIEHVMRELGAPIEKAPRIMDRWGYTGSACIPMALHDAVGTGHVAVGDHVVLVGSGVGYNQAGVALRVTSALAGAR
ncbi:3-oxoacyl-ACP synthase III family protein [Sandaracinus amylolyticus]|nr:ketoacyl-ACP synthase III [Sandaracinus amylolyticus]